MNKEHWNTIILSEKCDKELVEQLHVQTHLTVLIYFAKIYMLI